MKDYSHLPAWHPWESVPFTKLTFRRFLKGLAWYYLLIFKKYPARKVGRLPAHVFMYSDGQLFRCCYAYFKNYVALENLYDLLNKRNISARVFAKINKQLHEQITLQQSLIDKYKNEGYPLGEYNSFLIKYRKHYGKI